MYFVPDYVHTIFKGETCFMKIIILKYYCNVIRPKCNVHIRSSKNAIFKGETRDGIKIFLLLSAV